MSSPAVRSPAVAQEGTATDRTNWWDIAERVLLVVLGLVSAVAVAALALALVGWYSLPAALTTAAPLAAGLLLLVLRSPSRAPTFDGGRVPLAVGIGLILLATVFWGRGPSEHVLVDRDPGMYVNLAGFVSGTGGLVLDYTDTPFAGVEPAFEPATYREGEARWEFQFNHLLPALGAVAFDIGGTGLLFRLPALLCGLGLLAILLLGTRLVRRPWFGVAAVAALGASAPLMYVARDMYTEALVLPLLWGGLLALLRSAAKRDLALAVLAGSLLGTTVAARGDSIAYLSLLAALGVVWVLGARRPDTGARMRLFLFTGVGAVAPAAIGLADLRYLSGTYGDLRQFTQLQLGFVGIVFVTLAGCWLARRGLVQPLLGKWRAAAGLVVGIGVFVTLGILWLVRPLLAVERSDQFGIVAQLQAREGLPIDSTAVGYEDSMRWVVWYFGGFLLAIAILAMSGVAYRVITGRASSAEVVVGSLAVCVGLLYWWSPTITPDQLWATRRYVPVVYPAVVLMGLLGFSSSTSAALRAGVPKARLLASAAVLLAIVPSAVTTWPIRWGRTQHGFIFAVESACPELEGTAVVSTSQVAAHAIRSWCEVPVLTVTSIDPDALVLLADEWALAGRDLYIVGTSGATFGGLEDVIEDPKDWEPATADLAIEKTLSRAPTAYQQPSNLQFHTARVETTAPRPEGG